MGEGQVGDMRWVRGNRAIRDHEAGGRDLLLFEYMGSGSVRYVGQMYCTGSERTSGVDTAGRERQIIVFELVPVDDLSEEVGTGVSEPPSLWSLTLLSLRERALSNRDAAPTRLKRRELAVTRSVAVRVYVNRRADGVCEGCSRDAPFKTETGRLYLEAHHIRRLSDGGPDHPTLMAALCPNCHRRAHHSLDRVEYNRTLLTTVARIERELWALPDAIVCQRGY